MGNAIREPLGLPKSELQVKRHGEQPVRLAHIHGVQAKQHATVKRPLDEECVHVVVNLVGSVAVLVDANNHPRHRTCVDVLLCFEGLQYREQARVAELSNRSFAGSA
eukprot:3001124-Alexandrium_andersonii.AAC.1